jgi:hypothetical protein
VAALRRNLMIKLEKTLLAYNSSDFNKVAKEEISNIDPALLPLQQGLSLSSYVGKTPFTIVILNSLDKTLSLNIKAGVFYTGIIAGCSCSDDPSPVDEQNEYCELQLVINKNTYETDVHLLEV